jgi:hypothetical protein
MAKHTPSIRNYELPTNLPRSKLELCRSIRIKTSLADKPAVSPADTAAATMMSMETSANPMGRHSGKTQLKNMTGNYRRNAVRVRLGGQSHAGRRNLF